MQYPRFLIISFLVFFGLRCIFTIFHETSKTFFVVKNFNKIERGDNQKWREQ